MAVNLTGPMRLTKAVAPVMKAQGTRAHREHRFRRGARADRIVDRLCRVEGGADPPDEMHGRGAGHRDACELRGTRPAGGHARATANLRPEQVERSASTALLKKPADKDDCAEMVVTMCRTETMTGQTVVIDAGRIFH